MRFGDDVLMKNLIRHIPRRDQTVCINNLSRCRRPAVYRRGCAMSGTHRVFGPQWIYKVRLRSEPKSVRPFCFVSMNHTKPRPDHVWGIELTDKPIWSQVNGARAKDAIHCNP